MPAEVPPSPALKRPTASRWARARHAVFSTLPGRLLLVGAGIKLALFAVRQLVVIGTLLDAVDTLGGAMVAIGLGYFLWKLIVRARHRLLWRVRRKLILSYVFIGVFPVLLVIAFFVVAGLVLLLNVSSYLVSSSLRNLAGEARSFAETTVIEIQRGGGNEALEAILARREAALAARYTGASIAIVSASAPQSPAAGLAVIRPLAAGPWAHADPPATLPAWVGRGFAALVPYVPKADASPDTLERPIVIRSVAVSQDSRAPLAVIVDIPLNDQVAERLRDETSVKVDLVRLIKGENDSGAALGTAGAKATVRPGELTAPEVAPGGKRRIPWFVLVDDRDWATGVAGQVYVGLGVNIPDMYARLAAPPGAGANKVGSNLLVGLLLIAGLFLVIEVVAFGMGLMLARSITGSIHSLFAGTARVRQGDFGHRIEVKADDQLGELASSFNDMTGSIEDLLRQTAEKKRMEEELRIARDIQMSLLPRGQVVVPGLSISALCVPAREVGGDYYDLLRLDDHRLGVLIADVAGKGTSAALYMAELKGLVLSLSLIHSSPRDLLIAANRIIRNNLDSRSFITMTYAVLDFEAGTMTYARAGHTPLMYRSVNEAGEASVDILAPDGMVLGLQIDDGRLFDTLLEEATLPLSAGDLLVFFTDGISEAMDADSDCFGESRLGRIVAEHGDLPPDQLRERILREIEAFVGGAPQHDDMTLILLKIERLARGASPAAESAVQARAV